MTTPPIPPAVAKQAPRRCLCGATLGVRLYISGYRCPEHTPAALAGRTEPDEPRRQIDRENENAA